MTRAERKRQNAIGEKNLWVAICANHSNQAAQYCCVMTPASGGQRIWTMLQLCGTMAPADKKFEG